MGVVPKVGVPKWVSQTRSSRMAVPNVAVPKVGVPKVGVRRCVARGVLVC